METLFFSIITTSLNPGAGMEKTMKSILAQTEKSFEVIIKDGGSTDGALERVLAAYPDDRIQVHVSKDKGIYDGMNQALPFIRGRYVIFMNTGDVFCDDKVLAEVRCAIEAEETGAEQANLKMADREPASLPRIFYGDQFNLVQKSVVSSAPTINDFTCYRNVPCHQVCFYGASLFAERGYDTKYRVRADYEHFLYSIYERKAIAKHLPIRIADYEGGGFSETPKNRQISAQEHREITERYLGKAKCRKFRMIMLLTLQPVRTKIAESPALSGIYNKAKSAIYRLLKR